MQINSGLSFAVDDINMATPLVEVEGVVAKVEWVNPTRSIKDRIAQYILNAAERDGLLRPSMRIAEASSGNTGMAPAYHGRWLGYGVTIVMPEHMSQERINVIRALGAELILCSKEGGFAEAAQIRDQMAVEDPNLFNPDQFSNHLNVECHHLTTGRELIAQVPKKIDAFVAGVGTGGTLMGVGQALRKRWPDVFLAAAEPAGSAVKAGVRLAPIRFSALEMGSFRASRVTVRAKSARWSTKLSRFRRPRR
jgi:cysteine synthase A